MIASTLTGTVFFVSACSALNDVIWMRSSIPANARQLNREHPLLFAQFKRANDGGVVVESSLRRS
jgi:hypothetical protein